MWSFSLSKYVKTGSVVSTVLIFSRAVYQIPRPRMYHISVVFSKVWKFSQDWAKSFQVFTIPLKLWSVWIDCSGFMSTMALTFSESSLRPSGVSLCLKNLQSVDLNCILLGWVRDCLFLQSQAELIVYHHVEPQSLCVWGCYLQFHELLRTVLALLYARCLFYEIRKNGHLWQMISQMKT